MHVCKDDSRIDLSLVEGAESVEHYTCGLQLGEGYFVQEKEVSICFRRLVKKNLLEVNGLALVGTQICTQELKLVDQLVDKLADKPEDKPIDKPKEKKRKMLESHLSDESRMVKCECHMNAPACLKYAARIVSCHVSEGLRIRIDHWSIPDFLIDLCVSPEQLASFANSNL